jgi:hypothetical protein
VYQPLLRRGHDYIGSSEMRWEMGFSASEIASTAFSNPKIFHSPCSGCALNRSAEGGMFLSMTSTATHSMAVTAAIFHLGLCFCPLSDERLGRLV